MATQSKDVLKSYFETDDIPTEVQFGHLIDSSLNLADPTTQVALGTISASAFTASNFYVNGVSLISQTNDNFTGSNTFGETSSADIHRFTGSLQQTSADIYGDGLAYPSYFLNHLSVGTILSNANLTVNSNISGSNYINSGSTTVLNMNAVNKSISSSNITLSNNLSASGYVSASSFRLPNNALVSQLTSSGLISSSGTVSGSNLHIVNNTTVKGDITSLKTGSFEYIKVEKDISASGHLYAQTYKGKLGKQLIEYDTSIKIGTSTDSLPVEIFGNITSSGHISSSGLLYFSSSKLEGSSNLKTLTIANSGKLFHTGSYKVPTYYSDLDWFIGTNYLSSSKVVHITASSTNPAFNVSDNSDSEVYDDMVKFYKASAKKVSISGDGKMNINFLSSEYNSSIFEGISEHASNFYFTSNNIDVYNTNISLNVNGKVRIKTTNQGQCRLYFEDSDGGVVHSIMNKTGSFSFTNNSSKYNPITVHYHDRPDDDPSTNITNRGGSIVFKVLDTNSNPKQAMRILGEEEYYNNINDSQGVQFGPYGDFGFQGNSDNTVGFPSPHEMGHVKGANVFGNMRASGDVMDSGTALTSDIRLKENIKDLKSSINTIKKLKPRRFDWKEEKKHQFNDIGFIAQELQEVIPELVTQDADENLYVSYEKLTPILVKTLQSQLTAIKSIKKRIEKLEK